LAFTARRLYGWSTRTLVLFFCGLVALSVGILLVVRPSGIWVFSAQIFGWVLLEIQLFREQGESTDYRYFKALVITFAVAFAVWIPDITGLVCDPDNHIFNLHSLWHVLTSLAIYWFYRYQAQFRSPSSKPVGTSG
jgi:cytosine/uracil/thiamine/allantoin permease